MNGRTHRFRRVASTSIVLALTMASAAFGQQQPPPRFTSTVEVTSVDATVVDDRGHPIAGLAQRHGTTIVVATHDATLAARAPRRVAMRDGRVAEAAALTA